MSALFFVPYPWILLYKKHIYKIDRGYKNILYHDTNHSFKDSSFLQYIIAALIT